MTRKDPRSRFEVVRSDLMTLSADLGKDGKKTAAKAGRLLRDIERILMADETDRLKLNKLAKMVMKPITGRQKRGQRNSLIVEYVAVAMFVKGLARPSLELKEEVAGHARLKHHRSIEKIIRDNSSHLLERRSVLDRERCKEREAKLKYKRYLAQLTGEIKALSHKQIK